MLRHLPILALSISLLLTGCPPRALSLPATTPELAPGLPQAIRAVRRFEDIDAVRDVVRSAEHIYVATDRGVLVYPVEGQAAPVRLGLAEGLPAESVLALAELTPGTLVAATEGGLVELSGTQVGDVLADSPVGSIAALLGQDDGTLWACGSLGVARRQAGGVFEFFGEEAECTTMAQAPEGDLWIGTSRGLWHVEGDIVREHTDSHGLPLPYVRSVLALGAGRALALLEGPGESRIGYFDGERWYGYAVPGLERRAIGLARRGASLFLVTPTRLLPLSVGGEGVALVALSRSDRFGALSYRARLRSIDSEHGPLPTPVLREPRPLAAIPPNHPDIAAPALQIQPGEVLGGHFYLARSAGGFVAVADANRGVLLVSDAGTRRLSSQNLVDPIQLSIASDSLGRTWVMSRDHRLARLRGGYLQPVEGPVGQRILALANGPGGAYLLTEAPHVAAAPVDPETGTAPESAEPVVQAGTRLIVSRILQDAFETRVEIAIPPGEVVDSVPVFGVAEDEVAWVCPRFGIEGQTRAVGCLVAHREAPVVTHHHRGATRDGEDGPGALSMPDSVTTIDLNERGMAWLSSVEGAVRVGESQAVIFGEARGVRGEVVSDIAAGSAGRVWIAAAEGLGYFEDHEFEFRLPGVVQAAHIARLALDAEGHLYGAGHGGLVFWDGSAFRVYGEPEGLPFSALRDVEVDAAGHVWILGEHDVAMLGQSQETRASTP
ncbi:MAG: hypothetical protein GXP55_14850 [Deltaproteobacteria bacterium]|nr:hypothetical protein [Deltaproteobacteria bacterium]